MQVLTRIGARRFYRAFYLNILQPSNMSLLYDSLTSNIKEIKKNLKNCNFRYVRHFDICVKCVKNIVQVNASKTTQLL